MNHPQVVVLDEPTAGLDPPSRTELHGLISDQRASGVTILFTTHYLEEARRLCDRVAFLSAGRIVALVAAHHLGDLVGRVGEGHFFVLAEQSAEAVDPHRDRQQAAAHDLRDAVRIIKVELVGRGRHAGPAEPV